MNQLKCVTFVGLILTFSFTTVLAEDPIDTRIRDMQTRKQLESKNLAKARHDLEEINQRLTDYDEKIRTRNLNHEEGQLELTRLREEIESYETLIKADQEDFDSYQAQYQAELVAFEEAKKAKKIREKDLLRKAGIGEKIDSITTTKGRTYENAVITAVTPFSINLRYSAGIARIPYEQLPESYIKRFKFDAEEAEFALELETIHRSKQAALSANERTIYNNSTGATNVAFLERQISRLRTRLSYYGQVKARNEVNAEKYDSEASRVYTRYSSYSGTYITTWKSQHSRYQTKARSSKAAAAAAAIKVKRYEAEIRTLQEKIRKSK